VGNFRIKYKTIYCILCQHGTISSKWVCFIRQHVSTHACHLQVLVLVTVNVSYT
jgi:hypothetical protein